MGLLTLLTDLGYRDHYVAALKARLLHLAPGLPVLDISHGVEPYNIAHAVHVLRAVFREFPAGTTHLITVREYGVSAGENAPGPGWLAAEHEGHFFVAADNGLLALLCGGVPERVVRLNLPAVLLLTDLAALPRTLNPTFEVLLPAAVRLARGEALASLGSFITDLYVLKFPEIRIQDNRITGHVVHVDHYGNLITDITREAVEVVGRGRPLAVHFGREVVREVRAHFGAAPPGEVVCAFNPQGQLCVAICEGNGSELLGLYFNSQVDVRFTSA
jgi:S-adenosylmethionine hydrolase